MVPGSLAPPPITQFELYGQRRFKLFIAYKAAEIKRLFSMLNVFLKEKVQIVRSSD